MLALAGQLERLGVECIEAGFPATSPGDFRAVEQICQQTRDCQVAALSDAKLPNIETTGAALKGAAAKTERALRDQHRQGLEDYLSWYQSEFPM